MTVGCAMEGGGGVSPGSGKCGRAASDRQGPSRARVCAPAGPLKDLFRTIGADAGRRHRPILGCLALHRRTPGHHRACVPSPRLRRAPVGRHRPPGPTATTPRPRSGHSLAHRPQRTLPLAHPSKTKGSRRVRHLTGLAVMAGEVRVTSSPVSPLAGCEPCAGGRPIHETPRCGACDSARSRR